MQAQLIGDSSRDKTYAIIFQTGDEFAAPLKKFASENHLAASHFTAIGAFSDATLAYFDWEKKQYLDIPVKEQVEVLTLTGDIALDDNGEPKVHAHCILGRRDGSTVGGHVKNAHVRPTLEVMLTESPRHLRRKHDPASGLALIDLKGRD